MPRKPAKEKGASTGRPMKCKLCEATFTSIEEAGAHAWKKHRKRLVDKRLRKIRENAARSARERNSGRELRTAQLTGAPPLRGGSPGSKR